MTRPCAFPDCHAPAVAKGLCAKHNMRLRRHGDPAKVNRAGRKDEDRQVREALSDVSDRSYARFQRGLLLLRRLGLDAEPVIKKSARPNGSMNWARFEGLAESMAAARLIELYPEEDRGPFPDSGKRA